MARKKKLQCSLCEEPPYLGGFCKEHHAERTDKMQKREAALKALHFGTVGDRLPDDLALRDELLRLREWWDRACRSVNYQIQDQVLLDEAKYAVEWCIALAQEIVQGEEAIRDGHPVPYSFKATRGWVWDRFSNLEAGLMSNGVKRPER